MLRRVVLFAAVTWGVALGLLLLLAAAGRLPTWPALVAAIGLGALLTTLLVMPQAAVTDILAALEAMRRDLREPPPACSNLASDELWLAILRLARDWRELHERQDAQIEESRQALAALSDALLLVNDRREVVDANVAAHELFGEKLIGRDLSAAIRNPSVLDAMNAVLQAGGDHVVEFELSAPVDLNMSARLTSLPGPRNGSGAVALVALHDLTAVKRAEQLRVDFVANASHELRTPLSALLGFIETLQGPAADDIEAQRRFLGIMHAQATRMSRLVEDLLSLSRIELNEHQSPTGRVSVIGVLRTVTQAMELRAERQRMPLEVEISSDCPPVVGDADELAQVLQNLVDNALKYGRPETPVTITVTPSARLRPGVALAVRDHGEGIPRAHLPRLTERFYRVDTARSRQLGGTGLGLAIVKHIVNRHRGLLEIDSEMGVGSTFTVHLRAAECTAEDVPAGGASLAS